jgi:hypothetical protein
MCASSRRDIGVIEYIERTEWDLFSEGAGAVVGTLRQIEPAGIPRIANQAGFFLEAPHAGLYELMSHRKLYFRQSTGTVFEGSSEQPPVAASLIYPEQDPVKARLPALDAAIGKPLQWEPRLEDNGPVSGDAFASIARPWLKGASAEGAQYCRCGVVTPCGSRGGGRYAPALYQDPSPVSTG